MIRATTPTEYLLLPDNIDLTGATQLYCTFKQTSPGSVVTITKTFENGASLVDGHTIAVDFTQEESLRFKARYEVEVMVNWIAGTKRFATDKGTVKVKENLIPEVI